MNDTNEDASDEKYVMSGVEAQAERSRLEQLEELHDAATLRRVASIGIPAGWRCLEIGAGAGSIAHALADLVGSAGSVVATDLNPRFLDGFSGAGRAVITHDITTGPVPPGDFDFVHCRAVLTHVEDLAATIDNILDSVRPGGWVLCEEPDYGSMEACDPDHPHAPDLAAFHAIMTLSGRTNGSAGRHTFEALRRTGLMQLESDSHGAIATGGSPLAQFRIKGLENARPMVMESGFFTDDSFNRMISMFNDPTFSYIENTWIATCGCKPEGLDRLSVVPTPSSPTTPPNSSTRGEAL